MRKESGNENKVVGWKMTVAETQVFLKSLGKTVITFVGYSADYENEAAMLATAKNVLSEYSPDTFLINIGGTSGGVGALYPLAKEFGFATTGIVSSLAAEYMDDISNSVDYVCFVLDNQWGGKLPDLNELSPTSQAMVLCSDIIIGIGGGKIARDELVFGREQGKPIRFYPAEINHKVMKRDAQKMGLPIPESFWGAAHETFWNEKNG